MTAADRPVSVPSFSPRTVAAILVAGSAAVLGGAFAFEYLANLPPCPLCLYQRVPYAVTAVLGLTGLALGNERRRAAGALAAAAAVAFVAGGGVAAFHVGVEQHWWAGTQACTGAAAGTAATLDELRAQIMAAPTVRCDEVPWSLFGISLAGYNLLISVAAAVAAAVAARRLLARPAG